MITPRIHRHDSKHERDRMSLAASQATTGDTPDLSDAYRQLIEHVKRADLIGHSASLLSWDQETKMPPKGLAYRAQQLAELSRIHHEMATDKRIGDWLAACEADDQITANALSDAAVNVRELRRGYDRAIKLPIELVVERSQVTSQAKHAWGEARKADDFARFEPWLERIIVLNRRVADCYGWEEGGEAWDALADGYEPGCTAAYVSSVFTPLRERLIQLIGRVRDGGKTIPDTLHRVEAPLAAQEAFVREVAEAIGFDFARGRLDVSTHPFCSGTHCNDVRLTTRFHKDNVLDALGSTMHEAGHGIYEQGLPEAHVGTPRGHAVSLSIHESQSRLWENHVGRSRAFWQWCQPRLAKHFGDRFAGFSIDDIFAAANTVQPSLIRVESDEVTYNMHIMVRFELERAMLRGDLNAADLPSAWNARYKEYLGVDVPSDAVGCLQDIHWSMGAMGYFPTYTLGNLYGAQFFEAAEEALGDLDAQLAAGNFAPLRQWLNERIHAPGQTHRSAELCEVVTGKPLSADPLMRHLERKAVEVYEL